MKLMKQLLFTCLLISGGFAFGQSFDGFALYNNQNNNTAYLVDDGGNIAHSWNCNTGCNYALQLKEDGNIIRGGVKSGGNQLNGAAVGGVVQEYDHNGNVVWEFEYSTADYVSHHDITLMPNGGVLLIAWEVKTAAEMTAAGYSGNSSKYPTHLVEVQPDGNGGGTIVWEWHMWDHLIQDTDANKPNYGVVADHPELMNINVATSGGSGPGPGGGGDWFHCNGVDYNDSLDQIVFSSRYLSEIFIIDHSTTTQEAAGHTGGNAGKGGDFLYRWGHPSNYGAPGTQIIPGACHDARWIKYDCPNAGYIQYFNNVGGPGNSSTVDAINPPLNGYNYDLTPGSQYMPATYDWRHECIDNASGQSAADRLPNGNIFVALSREYMYEVDSAENLVWQHNADPAKAFRYTCDNPGIVALLGANPCGLSGVEAEDLQYLKIYPNPSNAQFELSGLPVGRQVDIVVYDLNGRAVKQFQNTESIDLSDQENGIYIARVSLEDGQSLTRKLSLVK